VSSVTVPAPNGPAPAQTAAQAAAEHGLIELGGRPPLRSYVKELWNRRHFAYELARSRFRSQNEQDRLGVAWVVLTPLVNAAVYGFIFGVLIPSKSRPEPLLPFLIVGVFTFAFFSGCFADGARAIISNRGLVRTLHFPRAVLPIASVLQKVFELGAMIIVMCMLVLLAGEDPSLRWLRMFPAFFLMALFCAGVSFLAARLTIHVRDITQLIPFITRLIFYVSGIFFAVSSKFGGRGHLSKLLMANPLNIYITLVRDALIHKDLAADDIHCNIHYWEAGAAYGVVFFVIGFIYFWRAEGLYGRD
jgi:teichoic acid transport system permease protein